MKMPDVVKFLLARIEEDQAHAKRWPDDLEEPARGGPFLPSHVRAECEAKREIVDRYLQVRQSWLENSITEMHVGQQHLHQSQQGGESDGLYRAISYLASAYADHPDYRTDWRPD